MIGAAMTHDQYVAFGTREAKFNDFARGRSPEQWVWVLESEFECPVLRSWLASVIWWRFLTLKRPPDLGPLERLVDEYPRGTGPDDVNPYPMEELEKAFRKLGAVAQVDAQVKRRDALRMARKPKLNGSGYRLR